MRGTTKHRRWAGSLLGSCLVLVACGEATPEGSPNASLPDGGEAASVNQAGPLDAGGPPHLVADAAVVTSLDGGAGVCPSAGPPASLPAPLALSGTRLAVRKIMEPVTNGVAVPWSVHDTQLDVDCKPFPYVDGTIRCVPSDAELHVPVAERFADVAKTIPITLAPLAAPPPAGTLAARYFSSATSGPFGCGYVSMGVFARVGAPRAGTQYYEKAGAMASNVPEGYEMFDLIPEVASFVELQEVRTQLAGAIALRELHGTDGSRLFATGLYDTAHDVPVIPTDDGNGAARLLPPKVMSTNMAHLAPPPGGSLTSSWCGSGDTLFSTFNSAFCDVSALRFVTTENGSTYGVVKETATLYSCSSGGPDAPNQPPTLVSSLQMFIAPCASVPLTDWASAARVTTGGGRLTAAVYAIGGATFTPADLYRSFTDATLGVTCSPRTASDGSLRCLPHFAGTVAYADAACTSRVVAWHLGGTPAYAFEGSAPSSGFPTADGLVTVYAVGAPRPNSTLYRLTPEGGCSSVASPSFEIGAVMPPSTFAALKVHDL